MLIHIGHSPYKASKVYHIMQRVETLLNKLQEQLAQKAPIGQLLLTVQILQAELLHLQGGDAHETSGDPVAITPAHNMRPAATTLMEGKEEKTIEVLKVDEAEIEAELEEMRRKTDMIQKISVQNKPSILFDMEDDIPTLSHQFQSKPAQPSLEINETIAGNTSSVNEKLKQAKIDLGDTLTEVPIRDLRKAIGVNDRFLFINTLFRGDEVMYERSIKTINSFSILAEAEYWIQRELKVKNGWKDADEVVKQFYQLVKRRFS